MQTHNVLTRLVIAVLALIVLVLGLLLVVALTEDDESAATSPDQTSELDAPSTTSPTEVADDEAAPPDPPENEPPENEPPENEPAISAESPAFPDPFEPAPNEVQREAKQLGALVAYMLTNYEVDESLIDVLTTLPVDPALLNSLALQVQVVHHPAMWSRGTVEYAQLGGYLDDRISIMVVVRQDLGVEGSVEPTRTETRTMDVRLLRAESGQWEFEDIASTGGQPIERPADLAPLAVSVVDDPRIDLPDSALWDIYSGHTDDPLLQVMLDLAEQAPYSVTVLHTGHPQHVFGTPRWSNHTVGRAVDIYGLDSQRVIDSHDVTSSPHTLAQWVVDRTDIKEFGSPWRFPDAVAHTFTNQVHHDHFHIGVFPEGVVAEPKPDPGAEP